MTSTAQLYNWCVANRVPHFQGVHASNQLPDISDMYDARVIVNWSPSSGGSHWLCFIKQGSRGYWFDSYGLRPGSILERQILGGDPPFRRWIDRTVQRWEWNDDDMQGLTTDVCGQYSCWAALNGSPQMSREAWTWVSDNTARNDTIIQNLVKIPGFIFQR